MRCSASLAQKKDWMSCSSDCCLLIVKCSKSRIFSQDVVCIYVYCMHLLFTRVNEKGVVGSPREGPMHHLYQCWASRIITATSTCSLALSIASVEDCRWLSDRTSSAPAQWTSQHFEREGRRQHRAQRPWRKLAVSCLVVSIYLSFKAS